MTPVADLFVFCDELGLVEVVLAGFRIWCRRDSVTRPKPSVIAGLENNYTDYESVFYGHQAVEARNRA